MSWSRSRSRASPLSSLGVRSLDLYALYHSVLLTCLHSFVVFVVLRTPFPLLFFVVVLPLFSRSRVSVPSHPACPLSCSVDTQSQIVLPISLSSSVSRESPAPCSRSSLSHSSISRRPSPNDFPTLSRSPTTSNHPTPLPSHSLHHIPPLSLSLHLLISLPPSLNLLLLQIPLHLHHLDLNPRQTLLPFSPFSPEPRTAGFAPAETMGRTSIEGDWCAETAGGRA